MFNFALIAMAVLPFALAGPYPGCPKQSSGCVFGLTEQQGTLAQAGFECAVYDQNCNALHGHSGDCDPGTTIPTNGNQYLTVKSRGGAGSSTYATIEYQEHDYSDGTYVDCSSDLTGCSQRWIPFPC